MEDINEFFTSMLGKLGIEDENVSSAITNGFNTIVAISAQLTAMVDVMVRNNLTTRAELENSTQTYFNEILKLMSQQLKEAGLM